MVKKKGGRYKVIIIVDDENSDDGSNKREEVGYLDDENFDINKFNKVFFVMDTLKNALEGNKWEKAIPKEIQDMVFGDLK